MPASIICLRIALELLAGPMVATILVRRAVMWVVRWVSDSIAMAQGRSSPV